MNRPIKIYLGSNTDVARCAPWVNLIETTDADELWVDVSTSVPYSLNYYAKNTNISRIVFYDWFHTKRELDESVIDCIVKTQAEYDTVFYSLNVLSIPEINNQQKFDFLWNRCKSAYLDHNMKWYQLSNADEYIQYPLHAEQRSHKVLNLYSRPEPYRELLYQFLSKFPNHSSNWSKGIVLPSNGNSNLTHSSSLPARYYLDSTYASCQIESQYEGHRSIVYTEKTYDHLIQGRFVLNFGPQYYYSNLKKDGWRMPTGIDLSWDNIPNTKERFDAYLDCLDKLFDEKFDLHGLFLENIDNFVYNQNRLITKSYDVIE